MSAIKLFLQTNEADVDALCNTLADEMMAEQRHHPYTASMAHDVLNFLSSRMGFCQMVNSGDVTLAEAEQIAGHFNFPVTPNSLLDRGF